MTFNLCSIVKKRVLQSAVLALTVFACFFSLKPLIGEIYLSRGNYYLEQNMLYLAMDNYLAGLKFDQLNPELHQKTGLLFLDLSDRGNKVAYVTQGLRELHMAEKLTGDPVVDYRLGLAYEFTGENKKAEYYFRRAWVRSDGKVGR